MDDIRIIVHPPDGKERPVELPVDMKTEEFVRELVNGFSLPLSDANGQPIPYRLDNKSTGRTLEHSKTLQENGVQSGHNLLLLRATVAG